MDYRPIADYGFLSDCRSAALVSSQGSVDWLCWPRFDSPSLFGALLDHQRGGSFSVQPVGAFRSQRHYHSGTNLLVTVFHTDSGSFRVEDWLHTGSRQALCRRLKGLEGRVALRAVCDPRPHYGRSGPPVWEERMGYLVCEWAAGRLVLDGFPLPEDGQPPMLQAELGAGEYLDLQLGWQVPGPSDLHAARDRALEFWRDWSEDLQLPAQNQEQTLRSALVLKGLQYQPTGALLAAATTSLPETPGGERNYDYRYSWLRDSVFSLDALRLLGKRAEAQSFFDWLGSIALRRGDLRLQIMYGLDGSPDLPESQLTHLEGYCGSQPVRIGNAAATQQQLDVYGEVLDAVLQERQRTGVPLHRHRASLVSTFAERTVAEWRHPDEGIWEVRGQRQHFTYSKAMCWVALDRAVHLARLNPQRFDPEQVALWRSERDLVHAEVLERAWNPRLGAFAMAYDSDQLDASCLLLAQIGFLPAEDPRFVATVRAIQQQLRTPNGLLLRYQADTDDGFQGEEGAFLIASYWLVVALHQIGEAAEARQVAQRLQACANDLGLFSEEVAADGSLWGNFPQAFSHIAQVACAFLLDPPA